LPEVVASVEPDPAIAGFTSVSAVLEGCGLSPTQTQSRCNLLCVFSLFGQNHDPLTECDLIAGGMVDMHDDAVIVRFHLHGGFVGLDVGQDVAFLDRVSDLDQPLSDHPGFHRGAELRHRHFDWHVSSPSIYG